MQRASRYAVERRTARTTRSDGEQEYVVLVQAAKAGKTRSLEF